MTLLSNAPPFLSPTTRGNSRRDFMLRAGAVAALPLASIESAFAQATPNNLRIVVGFPPGGGADASARLLSERLGKFYASVVVDNRPGAGSRIALDHLAHSKNDGSVVAIAPDFALTIHPHIYKRLPYDPLKSFTPVALLSTTSLAFCVGPQVPSSVTTLKEYVQWVRTSAKVGLYGTAGAGSTMDFTGGMLGKAAGIKMVHVAYKGGAAALQDLMGSQLPAAITGLVEPLQHAQTGRLRVLATSGSKRALAYPDVPTFAESGYKDLVVVSWYALLAPPGTPAAVVAKLNERVNEIQHVPAVIKATQELGLEPVTDSPSRLTALTTKDQLAWGGIIRGLNYVPED